MQKSFEGPILSKPPASASLLKTLTLHFQSLSCPLFPLLLHGSLVPKCCPNVSRPPFTGDQASLIPTLSQPASCTRFSISPCRESGRGATGGNCDAAIKREEWEWELVTVSAAAHPCTVQSAVFPSTNPHPRGL